MRQLASKWKWSGPCFCKHPPSAILTGALIWAKDHVKIVVRVGRQYLWHCWFVTELGNTLVVEWQTDILLM